MRPTLTKDPNLYHRDIFIPDRWHAHLHNRYVRLTYTRNAAMIIESRGLASPGYVVLGHPNVLELGLSSEDRLESAIISLPRGAAHRLYLSLSMDWLPTGLARVRTLWEQHVEDAEYFVDRRLYRRDPLAPGVVRVGVPQVLPNGIDLSAVLDNHG